MKVKTVESITVSQDKTSEQKASLVIRSKLKVSHRITKEFMAIQEKPFNIIHFISTFTCLFTCYQLSKRHVKIKGRSGENRTVSQKELSQAITTFKEVSIFNYLFNLLFAISYQKASQSMRAPATEESLWKHCLPECFLGVQASRIISQETFHLTLFRQGGRGADSARTDFECL